MTATYDQASDDIMGLFYNAWQPTGHVALFPNVAGDKPTDRTPWARAAIAHATGGQATLSNATAGVRRNRGGIFTVQIFTPPGEGLSRGYSLAKIVSDAFQGVTTTNGVWFRSVRVNEVGPSDGWFQINVVVNFTYDELT